MLGTAAQSEPSRRSCSHASHAASIASLARSLRSLGLPRCHRHPPLTRLGSVTTVFALTEHTHLVETHLLITQISRLCRRHLNLIPPLRAHPLSFSVPSLAFSLWTNAARRAEDFELLFALIRVATSSVCFSFNPTSERFQTSSAACLSRRSVL